MKRKISRSEKGAFFIGIILGVIITKKYQSATTQINKPDWVIDLDERVKKPKEEHDRKWK